MSLATYQEYKSQREETRKKMKKIDKDVVLEAAAEFFAANPKINKIVWTQYTPYFNDGDVCEFGVYPCDWDNDDNDDDEAETNVGEDPKWYNKVEKFINLFEEEDLQYWFGDGSKVTLTRTSVGAKLKVEEYEHD